MKEIKSNLRFENYIVDYVEFKNNPDFEGEPEMSSEDCDCGRLNTSLANYVWLPFRFDGEMAYLDWHDEWRIEDYE